MGRGKIVGTYSIFLILLLTVYLGLILLIFKTSGKLFFGEIILLGIFLFITLIGAFGIYFGSRWGFSLLSLFFALLLFDLLAIYFFKRNIDSVFFITILVAAIGFISSVINIRTKVSQEFGDKKGSSKGIEVTHRPGKYLASKTGSSYHAPRCDWAKKIKENNRVWYDTEEEVKKAGLQKHSCLE